MRIRVTLRRDPAETKDLAVTVDGLATVADTAAMLWAADPGRKGTPVPDNLSLRIEEAFVGAGLSGTMLTRTDNLLESGLRPGSVVSLAQVSAQFDVPGASRGPAAATLRVLSGRTKNAIPPLRLCQRAELPLSARFPPFLAGPGPSGGQTLSAGAGLSISAVGLESRAVQSA